MLEVTHNAWAQMLCELGWGVKQCSDCFCLIPLWGGDSLGMLLGEQARCFSFLRQQRSSRKKKKLIPNSKKVGKVLQGLTPLLSFHFQHTWLLHPILGLSSPVAGAENNYKRLSWRTEAFMGPAEFCVCTLRGQHEQKVLEVLGGCSVKQ